MHLLERRINPVSLQCPPECSILSLLNTSHLALGISVKFNSVDLDGLSLICRGGSGITI